MARLAPGTFAPDFSWPSIDGQQIALSDYRGSPLLLTFFRYSGCRYCNLQFWSLTKQYEHWHAEGLNMLSFFESPITEVQALAERIPASFPLLADPTKTIYRRYQVEISWWGALVGKLRRRADAREVQRLGLLDGVAKEAGNMLRMPAQFLIAPDGQIVRTYYGNDLGDFLPLADVTTFVRQYAITRKLPRAMPIAHS